MAPTNVQHRRTHNLLLISKILNQRDGISPFTLVLDNLEQSGKPLVADFIRRANASKTHVIFVSFETLQKPAGVDTFITVWDKPSGAWQKDVLNNVAQLEKTQRKLIVFDSLNTMTASGTIDVPMTLSSYITPTTSLLSTYHTDVPESTNRNHSRNPYAPSTLTLLKYLATTILTTQSLLHILAQKAARERSVAEPVFGLDEGIEGVIQGLGANPTEGVVIEMEHRRKSGRGVKEWYFLPAHRFNAGKENSLAPSFKETVILLEDHQDMRSSENDPVITSNTEDDIATTFELGLTDKQRQDRDGVVLPYFDAQKGGGEGGRILYDMGEEDDFDEEEDEI